MNDFSAVRSGLPSLDQPDSANPITNAKASACQRHRLMVCQIRRRMVSDIVSLRPDKAPVQFIETTIDLSSIAQADTL
jgi:hypothetical protein